ncbi:hypothetical protein PI501_09010 [Staphylococcus epidermidis]|nr:hypothetical protein [Staphylococcus epidermidis]
MANSCLHILSKKEYTATRCQDGILLFWPIEGSMHFQQFMKERILSDELYIVNNMDVFSISDNGITLEVYISSDWFTELGYSFFNYHYISDLIQSKKEIKELVAQLTLNFLDNDVDKEQDIINKIVHILANEAIIDKKIAEDQYMYDYYGELKDELNYIYNHIEERLTLKDISNKLYVYDLKQFDFSSENLIFLNLYNHQLLNNNEIDLSNSAPLLFKTISKLKKHFKGYGLNVFSNPKVFNAVHLFDENGFKTTFGLIFNHLSWMTNQNQIEQRFYNIIENADQYYLYLYDWRVIESESNESDFKDVDIWINFEDEALIDEYICVIAKVDDEGGNINHMISQNLRHKYVWSTPFLMRVEENFRPYMHIMEHDFKKGPLKIRMKYNAVYLVEIYKKDKINKRRSTT